MVFLPVFQTRFEASSGHLDTLNVRFAKAQHAQEGGLAVLR